MARKPEFKTGTFFTSNGSDIWKVQAIVKEPMVQLVCLETQEKLTLPVSQAGGFHRITMPVIEKARQQKKPRTGKPDAPRKGAGPEKTGAKKKFKGSSQYFGVSLVAKNGRWRAQVKRKDDDWDGGQYAIEELAAAAVQLHLGNEEEAKRLELLAIERHGADAVGDDCGEWVCHGCAQEYGTKKPAKCTKCGGGAFEWQRARRIKQRK